MWRQTMRPWIFAATLIAAAWFLVGVALRMGPGLLNIHIIGPGPSVPVVANTNRSATLGKWIDVGSGVALVAFVAWYLVADSRWRFRGASEWTAATVLTLACSGMAFGFLKWRTRQDKVATSAAPAASSQ